MLIFEGMLGKLKYTIQYIRACPVQHNNGKRKKAKCMNPISSNYFFKKVQNVPLEKQIENRPVCTYKLQGLKR